MLENGELSTREMNRISGLEPLERLLSPMIAFLRAQTPVSRELAEAAVCTDIFARRTALESALRTADLEGPELWALAEIVRDELEERAERRKRSTMPMLGDSDRRRRSAAVRRLVQRGILDPPEDGAGSGKLAQPLLDACLRDAFSPLRLPLV